MIPRVYLFLILGALPLSAQTSVNDANKMYQAEPPTVAPYTPPANNALKPEADAKKEQGPMKPAAHVSEPKLAEFTVSPGTVREGASYKDTLRTTIKLTVPATKEFICHIVSADPVKVVTGNIKFIKGQNLGVGGIQINWKNIKHDCQVNFKAYDEANPEVILTGRLYLRKKTL